MLKDRINELFSRVPIEPAKIKPADNDKDILRTVIIAEMDAVALYEQMAANASNSLVKKMLLDIAKEEKTHMGEALAILKKIDPEQAKELEAGQKEVEEM